MKRLIVSILYILLGINMMAATETLGGGALSSKTAEYGSMVVDSNNVLYAAYREGDDTKGVVKKYIKATDTWEVVGTAGFTPAFPNYFKLAIDNNDVLYVAYKDTNVNGEATVMKFDGSSWVLVGSERFTSTAAEYFSMVFDSSNTPYLAYRDPANSKQNTVMKYDGSSWATVGGATVSSGDGQNPTLVFDSSDNLYLSYKDGANTYKGTVKKYDGSSWSTIGSEGFTAGAATDITMAIDSTDTLYVAFSDAANSSEMSVMKFDGTSWINVGNAGFTYDGSTDDLAKSTRLVISSDDTPYVAYFNIYAGYEVKVMKYNGTSWEDVGTFGTTSNWIDFVLDNNDIPHIMRRITDTYHRAYVEGLVVTPATKLLLPTAYVGDYYSQELNVSSFGTLGEYRVVDISSKFNSDVILNKPTGENNDSSEDGLDADGRALFTSSFDSTNDGLADNGVFAANSYHKTIKLAYSNEDNGYNAIKINNSNKDSLDLTFDIDNHTYDNVYLYGTSGNGYVDFKIKFYYTDGTTGETTVNTDGTEIRMLDWFNELSSESQGAFYVVNNLDRYDTDHTTVENANDPAIFGYRVAVENTSKVVDKIELIPVTLSSYNTQVAIFGINIEDDELLGNTGASITNISGKPSWLSVNGFQFKGIPTASDVNNSNFTFTLSDGNTTNDINYDANITVSTITTQQAVLGQTYSYTFTPNGGQEVWSAISIPSWLELDSSTGVLEGTPRTYGLFPVKVQLVDGNTTDIENFYLVVKNDTNGSVSASDFNATADTTTNSGKNTFKHKFTVDGQDVFTEIIAPSDANTTINAAGYAVTKKHGITIDEGSADMEVINFSNGTLEATQITNKNLVTKASKIKIITLEGKVEFTDSSLVGENNSSTMSANCDVNGTMIHTVKVAGKDDSKVISSFEGATTTISDSNITTEVEAKDLSGTEGANWIMKAIAVTDANGKTQTKFMMENTVTGATKELDQTLEELTPYDNGAQVEIKTINGMQYFKTNAPLSDDLIVK